MQSTSKSGAGVFPKQSSEAPRHDLKPKPFPWGQHFWNIPPAKRLCLPAVEKEGDRVPYIIPAGEFDIVIKKSENICVGSDSTFVNQLSVICWAKRCLDKNHLFPDSHKREWILRIKRAACLALKTMREQGEDPVLYFPNKLPEYERAFAD
jgi:hypothetical protein